MSQPMPSETGDPSAPSDPNPLGVAAAADRTAWLGSADVRAALQRFVRGRAPASEVDDIVQTTLADALASKSAPDDPAERERWLYGVARNKVADHFRKAKRETSRDPERVDETAAESAPISARELLRWAERELPDGEGAKSTLEWMLREGSGEKLEDIAEEQKLPAPRVRQRVSRLRRHFRERWAAALAALALVAFLLLGLVALIARLRGPEPIVKEPAPAPEPTVDRAYEVRRQALEACDAKNWNKCLEGLDRAKVMDPLGDQAEPVQRAREAASRALAPTPTPIDTQDVAPPPVESAPRKAPPPAPKPSPKAAPKTTTLKAPNRKTTSDFGSSDFAPLPQQAAPQQQAPAQQNVAPQQLP